MEAVIRKLKNLLRNSVCLFGREKERLSQRENSLPSAALSYEAEGIAMLGGEIKRQFF